MLNKVAHTDRAFYKTERHRLLMIYRLPQSWRGVFHAGTGRRVVHHVCQANSNINGEFLNQPSTIAAFCFIRRRTRQRFQNIPLGLQGLLPLARGRSTIRKGE